MTLNLNQQLLHQQQHKNLLNSRHQLKKKPEEKKDIPVTTTPSHSEEKKPEEKKEVVAQPVVLTAEDDAQQRADQKKERADKRQQDSQKKEADLINSTQTLFRTLSDYLRGELMATSEDYKLLENMNVVTKDKYGEMTSMAAKLGESMKLLQEKYKTFQPYLEKIDEIDSSVTDLEKTVVLLDEYTQRLEEKFKHLKQIGRIPYKRGQTTNV